MLNHINTKYSSGIPLPLGDIYYAQDLTRDFRFHQYRRGILLERLFGTDTIVIEGLIVSQGAGHTLNITAGKAIIPFQITILDRDNAWTLPPDTETVDITALTIIESAITNMSITGATTDGVTTNYVKLSYSEDDSNTRTRAKSSGSYAYEVIPSYSITVNSTSPTGYEISLADFTSDGATITFTNTASKITASLADYESYIEVTTDTTLTVNQKYIITEENINVTLPSSGLSIGDSIEIYSFRNNYLSTSSASIPINYKNKYTKNTSITKGINLISNSNTKLIYKGNGFGSHLSTFAITDPTDTYPTGTGNGVCFSHDRKFMAIAHATSPYISIYSIGENASYNTFTKLSNPASLPTGTANYCAFSFDNRYLAVAHDSSPYVTIYSISGSTFTKLSNPASLPAGNANGVCFSYDGNFMAVAHDNSPYVTIYSIDKSTDTFTKLSNPSTLPTGNANGVCFSYDGNFLAVAHDSSPYFTTYGRLGVGFNKIPDATSLPAGNANGVCFSHDGNFLAVAHDSSPYVTIYRFAASYTMNKLVVTYTLPAGNATDCKFSFNDKYLAVTHATTPFFSVYEYDEDSFVKISDSGTLPASNANGCAFSFDNTLFSVVETNANYVLNYRTMSYSTNIWLIESIESLYERDKKYMFLDV